MDNRPLDDADVLRVAALADVPTLKAWLAMAHARAGTYRLSVETEPVHAMQVDIEVPIGDEPLILNNAGQVAVYHPEQGKGVGVCLRYTLSSPANPPDVAAAVAMEREACAMDASYRCRCTMEIGEGYRGTAHSAECCIRNQIAAKIRARGG